MNQDVENITHRIKHLPRDSDTSIVDRYTEAEEATHADADQPEFAMRELCTKLLGCAGLVCQFGFSGIQLTIPYFEGLDLRQRVLR